MSNYADTKACMNALLLLKLSEKPLGPFFVCLHIGLDSNTTFQSWGLLILFSEHPQKKPFREILTLNDN